MAEKVYKVKGMTCGGCAGSVEQVVGKIAGVTGAKVVLDEEKLTVTSDGSVTDAAVKAAVEDAGFDLG